MKHRYYLTQDFCKLSKRTLFRWTLLKKICALTTKMLDAVNERINGLEEDKAQLNSQVNKLTPVIKELRGQVEQCKTQLQEQSITHKSLQAQWKADYEQKHLEMVTEANRNRKSAAARANRFKAKYDAPFVKGRAANTMLSAQVRHWNTRLTLFQYRQNFTVFKSRSFHAESP